LLECLKYDPNERPDMLAVVSELKTIISSEQHNIIIEHNTKDLNSDLMLTTSSERINNGNDEDNENLIGLIPQNQIKMNSSNNSTISSIASTNFFGSTFNKIIFDKESIMVTIKKHYQGHAWLQLKNIIKVMRLIKFNDSLIKIYQN
jgi:hypothetical protein